MTGAAVSSVRLQFAPAPRARGVPQANGISMTTRQDIDRELGGGLVGQALDGLCVGFVTVNAAGRILWMNRAAQSTLGLDLEEMREQPLAQVLRDPQMAAFWHEAMTCEHTVGGEITLHWPCESHLKVNATAALDPAGEVLGRALLFCDVTDQREVQVRLSQEATQRLLDMAGHWNETAEAKAGLTPQELRVLRMVGAGLSNPQIAGQMDVALSTVRSHLKNLYSKLGLKSRSEAISYALRNGLA